VNAIRDALSVDGDLLRRYTSPDDFGVPKAAFLVCTFWLVEALALIGRTDEARELFEHLLGLHNGLGLYAENILPDTLQQSGNFPQTYSHVGLINAAFRVSRRWD
jgi:GH15 family glucan-1,4-alpha-glucosidase